MRIYDDKEYGINDNSDTVFIDEDDEDQHYSRKRATLIIGKLLLLELTDAYKTLSLKMYNIQWRKIQELAQRGRGGHL